MDPARIVDLLQPFIVGLELTPELLEQLQRYLDLLLRWNARVNLTAVRDPEDIVTRHFGESLFAAQVWMDELELKPLPSREPLPPGVNTGTSAVSDSSSAIGTEPSADISFTVADVGSGAGFPGGPIKLLLPRLQLTLIESQHKKATFLRELLRELQLDGAEVFGSRAETWGKTADLVTLRAVEQFDRALPVAASLVAPGGRLCLLIGASQMETAVHLPARRGHGPTSPFPRALNG